MKGVLSQLTFRRLALAVVPTALLTAGGWVAFGGGDERRERPRVQRPAPVLGADPTAPPSEDDVLGVAAEPDGAPEPDNPKAKRKRAGAADDPADVSAGPAPPAPDPTADATAAVRQAVTDTLASLGYTGARVEVADGGGTVAVAVSARQACDPEALAGDRLAERIRSGLPEVRTVRVTVRGSGQSLAGYRRARCGASGDGGLSEGSGRVVYSRRGSGTLTTPAFTIAARTWSVTYSNESDFFQAFVLKDGRVQPFVLTSQRRGTRTDTLRGPGRFRLRINGAEGWSVRVRDGA